MNKTYLKLAIQKEGRLTEESVSFLKKSGLEFENYKQRLYSACRNFPLEIVYVRDNDIPDYVTSGTIDLGIIGQNILNEEKPRVKKLLNLRFGYCSLIIAVPKESPVQNISDLKGKKIATSYPNSSKYFFQKENIKIDIVKISGSVEITPTLGVSEAIVDLTSTGSTLELNDLRILTKIYDSEAVLITNPDFKVAKKLLVNKLLTRFKAVLSAKNYKYILMNSPISLIPKLVKIIPGLKSPTLSPLTKKDWISLGSVVKEDIIWETAEKLKALGVSIVVLPIEKIIT